MPPEWSQLAIQTLAKTDDVAELQQHQGDARGRAERPAKHTEHMKAAVRSKVKHPFRVFKRQFGYRKVQFKALVKRVNSRLS